MLWKTLERVTFGGGTLLLAYGALSGMPGGAFSAVVGVTLVGACFTADRYERGLDGRDG